MILRAERLFRFFRGEGGRRFFLFGGRFFLLIVFKHVRQEYQQDQDRPGGKREKQPDPQKTDEFPQVTAYIFAI